MDSISNDKESDEYKYIDCHCHLQYYSKEELKLVTDSCIQKGFVALLTNSTSLGDFDTTFNLANENYTIYNKNNNLTKTAIVKTIHIIPGFGYHPWELQYALEHKNWFEEFKSFLGKLPSSQKYFIGEIGIDGGKIKKTFPLKFQIEIFTKQIQYANENNFLVHIHCVYEWDKLYKIMNAMKLVTLIKNKKIILHSFQGKSKHIDKFNAMNVWYSLSAGCYCDKNIEMIKKIPLDRLVYESDSPSMFNSIIYPLNYDYNEMGLKDCVQNKKNTPISIVFLNATIAEIKCIKPHELSVIVFNNSKRIIEGIIS